MAVLERKKKLVDTLELKNEDGSTFAILNIDLDVDRIMTEYNRARNDVIRAQQKIKADPQNPEILNEYGKAIVSVLDVLFGTENTKKLLEFYENKYSELLEMIFPYISNEIEPRMREIVNDKVAKMKAQFNRKQWRKFGL